MKEFQSSHIQSTIYQAIATSWQELLTLNTKAQAICNAVPIESRHENAYGLWFECFTAVTALERPSLDLIETGIRTRPLEWHETLPTNALAPIPDSIKLDNILMRLFVAARALRDIDTVRSDVQAHEVEAIIRAIMHLRLPGANV